MSEIHKSGQVIPDPKTTPTLRVPEVAAILGVSRDTAYQAVKCGELPVIRLRGALRVPTAALLAMLGVTAESHSSFETVTGDGCPEQGAHDVSIVDAHSSAEKTCRDAQPVVPGDRQQRASGCNDIRVAGSESAGH